MEYIKKGMAFLLAVCLVVSGVFVSPLGCDTVEASEGANDTWVEDAEGNGYWYREMEGGGIEITAFMGPEPYDGDENLEPVEITVPSVLDGKNVVRIGAGAYDGVSTGYCRDCIKKITVPEGITSIGNSAFRGCENLAELILPDSLTTIGKDMIDYCILTEITIPKGVTSIEEWAFLGCKTLTAIHVAEDNPAYASQDGVLYNKDKTTLICYPQGISGAFTIPEHVTAIEDCAFYQCQNLTEVTITGNVAEIGESAFSGSSLTRITVPGNVKTIGESAFFCCSKLVDITLEEGIETIGGEAFVLIQPSGLTAGLTEITIPASVTSLESDIFGWCGFLQVITVAEGNQNYTSDDGIVYDKNKTTMLICPEGKSGKVSVPASVTDIEVDTVFERCEGLTEITVDEANMAYASEDDMLYDKDKTTLLFCPLGKEGAAVIPASVTEIDAVKVFKAHRGITAINVDAENGAYTSEDGVLYDKDKTVLLYCPEGKYNPSNDKVRIEVPDTVLSIPEDAFDHNTGWPSNHLILVCYKDSAADEYAFEHGIDFEASREAYTYTITFDANGGTNTGESSLTVKEGKSLRDMGAELPAANRTGYDFLGWYTAKTEGKEITEETKITGSQTVYAHWEEPTQPEEPEESTQPEEPEEPTQPSEPEEPTQPAEPEEPTQPAESDEPTQPSVTGQPTQPVVTEQPTQPSVTEEPTQPSVTDEPTQPSVTDEPTQPSVTDEPTQPSVTEQPTQDVRYIVTFDKNGGSRVSKDSVTIANGQTIGELPTAQRKGYSFEGWYTAKKGGEKVTSSMKVTQDQTIYAQWKKVTKPKKVGKISLKSKKSGQLTVSYGKISSVKGYEICYSTKKNFKKAKKKTVAKTKATIKKLKKNTVYYVKVRAYKLDSTGGKVYGKYSAFAKLQL